MRRLGQWMTAALVVWALVLTVAWFISEGEPVCEGILITSSDDSDPPQCPGRIDGLLQFGPPMLGLSVAIAGLGFVATRRYGNRGTGGDSHRK